MDAKCPVCRDDIATMAPDHQLLTLACGHLFCTPCLEHWFGEESTCPSCRRPHPTSLRRCAQSTAGGADIGRERWPCPRCGPPPPGGLPGGLASDAQQ